MTECATTSEVAISKRVGKTLTGKIDLSDIHLFCKDLGKLGGLESHILLVFKPLLEDWVSAARSPVILTCSILDLPHPAWYWFHEELS
jgi:hypothetical protein